MNILLFELSRDPQRLLHRFFKSLTSFNSLIHLLNHPLIQPVNGPRGATVQSSIWKSNYSRRHMMNCLFRRSRSFHWLALLNHRCKLVGKFHSIISFGKSTKVVADTSAVDAGDSVNKGLSLQLTVFKYLYLVTKIITTMKVIIMITHYLRKSNPK